MNEVTTIHLGRQAFNIAADAHRELRSYLDAIKKQVGDEDVVNEVEVRMSELLAERGIKGEKVILSTDVDFLKKQLGKPKDFKDDDTDEAVVEKSEDKRLFRDTNNAMIAGVASGLSKYFGIDAWIIRILFLLSVLIWGWGILVYIVLWLLIPEAKTSSDQLLMVGKPVTVESLKEIVDRADVKGATKRANNAVAPIINTVFRVALKIIGIGFVSASLAAIFGLVAIKTYMVMHHGQLFEENLFPVGTTENVLANLALVLAGLIALFGIVCGLAIFKRKWPIRGWITGVLSGVFLIALAISMSLAFTVVPRVRDRYLSQTHTITRSVKPYQGLVIQGKDLDYQWEYADTYSVSFSYFGNPDISKIKTTVNNNVLTIDSSNYNKWRNCDMLCIFPAYDLMVTVRGPQSISTPNSVKDVPQIYPMNHNKFNY